MKHRAGSEQYSGGATVGPENGLVNRIKRLLKAFAEPEREAGWTFIETIIVIGIIVILTSSVGFAVYRYVDRAKQAAVRNELEVFSLALNAYMLDCEGYPTSDQGLKALREKPSVEPVPAGWAGPYVDKDISADPWGTPYEYTVPGPNGLPFGVRSLGSDKAAGGEGNARDLSSWESK